jgi:hypothetical protein
VGGACTHGAAWRGGRVFAGRVLGAGERQRLASSRWVRLGEAILSPGEATLSLGEATRSSGEAIRSSGETTRSQGERTPSLIAAPAPPGRCGPT